MQLTWPGLVRNRLAVAAAVTALGLGVAGCGSDGGGTGEPSGQKSPGASDTAPSGPSQGPTAGGSSTGGTGGGSTTGNAGSSGNQGMLAAASKALKEVGRGTVTSIDAERNGTVWEVQVVTSRGVEHEVDLSSDGRKVLSGPRFTSDDAEDRAENRREAEGAKLDYRAAAKKVLEARAGTITELNLDDHRGKIVWESDVHEGGTKYEVKVDAADGRVVANKAGTDDDEDGD